MPHKKQQRRSTWATVTKCVKKGSPLKLKIPVPSTTTWMKFWVQAMSLSDRCCRRSKCVHAKCTESYFEVVMWTKKSLRSR